MPVLAKFCGIVIRMLVDPTFGVRFHAFYEGSETVIAISPTRVLQSDAPKWVQDWALHWVSHHQNKYIGQRSVVGQALKRAA